MLQVQVEPVTLAAVPAHMALAKTTYDDPVLSNSDHFRWKHIDNPCGVSTSVSLYNEQSDLVGRALVQPRAFRVSSGETRRAGIVVDLMLAPTHRSAINFIQLVKNQTKAQNFDLLVHTSNENSDPLYRKLLRYPVAFSMQAYMLPLRLRNILKKLTGRTMAAAVELLTTPLRLAVSLGASVLSMLTGLRITDGLPSAEHFDELMRRFETDADPHFERSYEFLQWRFGGPVSGGSLAAIHHGPKIIGYVGWRNVTLEGLNFFVVMDIVVVPKLGRAGRLALWLELARRASASNADALFIMINAGNRALAKVVGLMLIPVPERRLPHPTPIFVLPQEISLKIPIYASTYMTLADIDYF